MIHRSRHVAVRAFSAATAVTILLASTAARPFDFSGVLDDLKKSAPQKLGEALGAEDGKKKKGNEPPTSGADTAAGVVGLLGASACKQKRGSHDKLALCAMGTLVAVEMTRQLGTKIANGLREYEQRQVLVAASDSLKTGEPNVVDLPDSGNSVAITPTGSDALRQLKVELLIDQGGVADVPLVRVLAETQDVRGAQKLLNSPGSKGSHVGSLRAGETVHAIGKVDGADWVLVSRWVNSDGQVRPVGTGYVSATALQPSAKKDFPANSDLIQSNPGMKLVTVNAIVKCQSLNFKKKDAKGNVVTDTSMLCIGPDGNTISA